MLNPTEKFKDAILHLNRDWNPCNTVMENCYFSYASFIFVLNACTANLPLPFSIITSKCIFEVGVPILFGFSLKLSVDPFQWESSLIDCVIEFHSSPLEKI